MDDLQMARLQALFLIGGYDLDWTVFDIHKRLEARAEMERMMMQKMKEALNG